LGRANHSYFTIADNLGSKRILDPAAFTRTIPTRLSLDANEGAHFCKKPLDYKLSLI
jgi:hypothetical protein